MCVEGFYRGRNDAAFLERKGPEKRKDEIVSCVVLAVAQQAWGQVFHKGGPGPIPWALLVMTPKHKASSSPWVLPPGLKTKQKEKRTNRKILCAKQTQQNLERLFKTK